MKPSIRKQDGRWLLTRPGYGFGSSESVQVCGSWAEARAALLGTAVGSAGPQWERASALSALRWGPPHADIRAEDQP